ncbi:MAG: LysR family transcriptional regulator [Planctomycetes bacterium HGW-Planctomycetes-1]|nr:MAG: LysR family transcriptional regulator [Planctomycetes bacterium HGW-Planctomycetes-1]
MQIETLQIFCDLAELKSFSKSAEKNMLSQSAVSQQLAQLEKSFHTPLIDRSRKSFSLTDAGELFYNTCKDVLSRYESFQSSLNYLKSSTKSKISIAAIYSIGMHSLQSYVKKFMELHPQVYLDIEYLSAAEIYNRLLLGKIDVGLVAVPRNHPDIQIFDFVAEPLVLVCSPQHPFAKKTSVDVYMMQYEPFIAFAHNVPTRNWIDQLLLNYNIAVKPIMEFDNVETIKRVVEINAGISIMPETTIKNELANGTLKAIPFSNEKFTRPTAVIIRKNRVMNNNLKAFVDILRSKIK